MSNIIESELHKKGFEIMGMKNVKVGRCEAYESFSLYFGVTAQVLEVVWKLLVENDALEGAVFENLLWACMLMKQYTGDRCLSKAAGVDRKTFRKWAWTMISAMSWLEGDVVSCGFELNSFMYS